MKVAVIGGRLQGVEAVYLARKAGWETLVVDRLPEVPAARLAHEFRVLEVGTSTELEKMLAPMDLIIPAIEDAPALDALTRAATTVGVPLAYDPAAYAISSSKLKSNRLFANLGLELPAAWPGCPLPVILKPDGASGSQGVRLFDRSGTLESWLAEQGPAEKPVIQEFVAGPSFSLEILGVAGQYLPLQATDLGLDRVFDCRRVTAPSLLEPSMVRELERIGLAIAAALNLTGIMDVEVIRDQSRPDRLVLLEIDARLPSQTPTAVYWSTGVNMVALLAEIFRERRLPVLPPLTSPRGVIFEHIRVGPGLLEVCGEHVMASAGPLTPRTSFWGADEALTNHQPGRTSWVATMIYSARNLAEVWAKRDEAMRALARDLDITGVFDPGPAPDRDEHPGP